MLWWINIYYLSHCKQICGIFQTFYQFNIQSTKHRKPPGKMETYWPGTGSYNQYPRSSDFYTSKQFQSNWFYVRTGSHDPTGIMVTFKYLCNWIFSMIGMRKSPIRFQHWNYTSSPGQVGEPAPTHPRIRKTNSGDSVIKLLML